MSDLIDSDKAIWWVLRCTIH